MGEAAGLLIEIHASLRLIADSFEVFQHWLDEVAGKLIELRTWLEEVRGCLKALQGWLDEHQRLNCQYINIQLPERPDLKFFILRYRSAHFIK